MERYWRWGGMMALKMEACRGWGAWRMAVYRGCRRSVRGEGKKDGGIEGVRALKMEAYRRCVGLGVLGIGRLWGV